MRQLSSSSLKAPAGLISTDATSESGLDGAAWNTISTSPGDEAKLDLLSSQQGQALPEFDKEEREEDRFVKQAQEALVEENGDSKAPQKQIRNVKQKMKMDSNQKLRLCKDYFPVKPQFTPQRSPARQSKKDQRIERFVQKATKRIPKVQTRPKRQIFEYSKDADFEDKFDHFDVLQYDQDETHPIHHRPRYQCHTLQETNQSNKNDSKREWSKRLQDEEREYRYKYGENFRVNYKTEICKNWLKMGRCEFQDECTFAHGYEEMHQKTTVSLNKNYKSTLCKQWHKWTPKFCRYGDKCQFLHDERVQFGSGKEAEAPYSYGESSDCADESEADVEHFTIFNDVKLLHQDSNTEGKTEDENLGCSANDKAAKNHEEHTFSNPISSTAETVSNQSPNEEEGAASLTLRPQRSSSCGRLMTSVQDVFLDNDQFHQLPATRKRLNIFQNITTENT